MRIGVLNNLRAGKSEPVVSKMLGMLERYPGVVHVETDSAQVLPEILSELLRHEIDLLIVNGGDGTLQYTLSELLNNPDLRRVPWVAPLCGGRTNMTALDMGAHRNPMTGLRQVLEAADAGRLHERVVDRPVLRVASTGREEVQYGMFFGVGVIRRAIALVHRVFPPGSQGAFGASLVTGALLLKTILHPNDGIMTPDKASVVLDREHAASGEYYLMIASTLHQLFSRMNPFWGTGPGDIRFTSMTSKPHRFGVAAPGILRGKPRDWVTPENGYDSTNATRIELRIDCGFTIDGELFEPTPDEVVTLSADRRVTFVRA